MEKQLFIVTCSTKDSARTITGIGGTGWRLTREDAVRMILARTHEFRVLRADGPLVEVLSRPPYLRSEADGITRNNLDSLPSCV